MDRARAGDGQCLDGIIHALSGHGLQHVDRQDGLAGSDSSALDCAADASRQNLGDEDLVHQRAVLDHHDPLARAHPKRPGEVRGVVALDLHNAAVHGVGVDKEARHARDVRAHCIAVAEQLLSAKAADGSALAVSVEGEGQPLLLIPGLGATRRVFDPLMPALRGRHLVIRFDPRGVGDSERGAAPITMAVLAADAVAVIDAAAGAGLSNVFGASMGGVVAQQLAVDHPDRLLRLVLAATQPPGSHAIPAGPASRAALLGRGAHTPEEAYRIACTVLYSPQFQRAHPEFIEEQVRLRAQHPIPARVFRDQLEAMRAASELWNELPAINAPTLVMHGTADMVSPFENADLLARRIPGARLRGFEGSGHLFFHERPEESARVISEFLRS